MSNFGYTSSGDFVMFDCVGLPVVHQMPKNCYINQEFGDSSAAVEAAGAGGCFTNVSGGLFDGANCAGGGCTSGGCVGGGCGGGW